MRTYGDSLQGYGHETHVKCNFMCQYCGYDGRAFPYWFQLTVDHIMPQAKGGTDDRDNLLTACHACNSITSRMDFPQHAQIEAIIAQEKQRVQERQSEYFEFWRTKVAPLYIQSIFRSGEASCHPDLPRTPPLEDHGLNPAQAADSYP